MFVRQFTLKDVFYMFMYRLTMLGGLGHFNSKKKREISFFEKCLLILLILIENSVSKMYNELLEK